MIDQTLIQQFIATCEREALLPISRPLIVGVSGGPDSLVLLHILLQLQAEWQLQLHVATLDHGLRGAAGVADADFVEAVAHEGGVACTRGTVDVPAIAARQDMNLEEAARQARYTFFVDLAVEIGARRIAIAHNRDDQAETILMHLIRGTGLHGLQGMRYLSPLSEDHLLADWIEGRDIEPETFFLARPMLDITRAMIDVYVQRYQLTPREDVTNIDTTRLRNAIRHRVFPEIKTLNPNIYATLNRLATVVQGDVEVIESRIETVAAWLLEWSETEPDEDGEAGEMVFMGREDFAKQPTGIQRGLLRKVLFDLTPGLRHVSFETIERARELILRGQTGTQIELPEDVVLQIGYDDVTLGYGGDPVYPPTLPALEPDQVAKIDPDGEGKFRAGNLQLMTYWVTEGRSKDLSSLGPLTCTLAIPEGARLALRTWQVGDRFRPFGMRGKSQKLSDTFTNMKVPAFYRDRVPLLTIDDEIAWFVAPTASGPRGRIADTFAVRGEDQSVLRLRWQPVDRGETTLE